MDPTTASTSLLTYPFLSCATTYEQLLVTALGHRLHLPTQTTPCHIHLPPTSSNHVWPPLTLISVMKMRTTCQCLHKILVSKALVIIKLDMIAI
jgi:hypothetical protein